MKPPVVLVMVGLALVSSNPRGVESRVPGSAWSEWSEPVNLGAVNSAFNEQNPFLSKDELTLYFTSNRPDGHGNLDIWVAHRTSRDDNWGPPSNLGSLINTASADLAPNGSIDGHLLFFASNRAGDQNDYDIYVAWRANPGDDSGWEAPTNVGAPVNTPDWELAPFYLQNAEDGSGNLYFNRGVQPSQLSDIYYASISRDGESRGAEVFVGELNSPMNDAAVTIRKDGRELFFWSQRVGSAGPVDIWTSTRQSIHEAWSMPDNVGAPINSPFVDTTPNLSFDGRTLTFASNRPGGIGGNDLWMSVRTRGTH